MFTKALTIFDIYDKIMVVSFKFRKVVEIMINFKKGKNGSFVSVAVLVLLPIFIIVLLNVLVCLAFFTDGFICLLSPTPPEPKITYAEFPFEIVYEIDGEIVTVNDVYVCEFVGVEWDGKEKRREWKGYIKSSGEKDLILLEDEDLEIAVSIGHPEYYMSDPLYQDSEETTPSIYYLKPNKYGGKSSGKAGIKQMLNHYKLELVSWEFSEPVSNSFE